VIFEQKLYQIVARISGTHRDCYSLFLNTFRVLEYKCHLKTHSKSYHIWKPISVKWSEFLQHLY